MIYGGPPDDYPMRFRSRIAWPETGQIYTVREVLLWDGTLRLRLHELHNLDLRWNDGEVSEAAFGVCRFRPLVTTKTSIAIFEKLLSPSPSREVETV